MGHFLGEAGLVPTTAMVDCFVARFITLADGRRAVQLYAPTDVQLRNGEQHAKLGTLWPRIEVAEKLSL